MTREVIVCKELKQRLSVNPSLLASNQQIVEVASGLFDSFTLVRTDLEKSTLRDNYAEHLVRIDSDLLDLNSQIRVDLTFNNLFNYPRCELTGPIRFVTKKDSIQR